MSKKKKEIRSKFRKDVFERDNHQCKMCAEKDCELDAHHITDRAEMPNGGYVKENGISLCDKCHPKAEKFHQTNGEEWVEGFHPDNLYNKIGSSKELAFKKSKNL
jgi:5-methylcytosine-specific restriction endonuclease McrA